MTKLSPSCLGPTQPLAYWLISPLHLACLIVGTPSMLLISPRTSNSPCPGSYETKKAWLNLRNFQETRTIPIGPHVQIWCIERCCQSQTLAVYSFSCECCSLPTTPQTPGTDSTNLLQTRFQKGFGSTSFKHFLQCDYVTYMTRSMTSCIFSMRHLANIQKTFSKLLNFKVENWQSSREQMNYCYSPQLRSSQNSSI